MQYFRLVYILWIITNLETVCEKNVLAQNHYKKPQFCKTMKANLIQNELNIKQIPLEEETADSFVSVIRKINILVIDL